jgi:hypothetical protein
MPPASYDLSPYGVEHFGGAKLGDARRDKSLIDLGNRLSRHPKGTLPDKFKDPKALRRCYDLMNTQAVTHAKVLLPHTHRTAEKLLEHRGTALCLHDLTELDFTSLTSLHDQLGQIGDGRGRGYECHNSLVVLAETRYALGLLAQQLHHRADVPEGETPAQRREREDRETLLWPHGAEAAGKVVAEVCAKQGLAGLPEGLRLVDVFDRGGDCFEFLDYLDANNRSYVGRAKHNRNIRLGHDADGSKGKLKDHLRSLPAQGAKRTITVRSHDGGTQRKANLVLSWAAVTLPPPQQQSGHSRQIPLKVWVVRVWEPNPPQGVEAVEWFLLTNVAVASAADAWERVDWYCARWVIEEYHKAQKTGCSIEDPQFTTVAALEPTIALLSVIAITLLNLRDMSRDKQTQDLPATEVVSQEEMEVLCGHYHKRRRLLTVREFFLLLARLGGHLNRKKDHPPGWLVLWRGWQSLQLMVAGARARNTPSELPTNPSKSDKQGATGAEK